MAKFALKADPTFVATVAFPVAGGDAVDVKVTFKHRTKKALDEFVKTRTEVKSDVESFMDMVAGWDLEDTFSKENVETLLQNHMGVSLAVFRVYLDELVQHRSKN